MSFAKTLETILINSDIYKADSSKLTDYDKGQLKMLNRVMVEIQLQLLNELTDGR